MRQIDFNDFDEFAASVRDVDCSMAVQNPAKHKWSLKLTNVGEVEVQFGKLGTGNIVEGKSWKEGVLVYLPLTPETCYRGNGEIIQSGAFLVMEPQCQFDLASDGAHDWCSIFVPSTIVDLEDAVDPSSKSYITQPAPVLANRMKALINQVLMASEYSEAFANSLAGKQAEDELLDLVARIFALPQTNNVTSEQGKSCKFRHVSSARKVMTELPYSQVRILEIAKSLGISDRTLQTLFQEYYGTSPKKFLLAITARSIQQELLNADPSEQTVSEILFDHGVFELGRFAAVYRQLYGELPSETLNRPN